MPRNPDIRHPLPWLFVALLLVGGCDTNRDEGEEGRRRGGGQESEEPREGDETVPRARTGSRDASPGPPPSKDPPNPPPIEK